MQVGRGTSPSNGVDGWLELDKLAVSQVEERKLWRLACGEDQGFSAFLIGLVDLQRG